MRSDTFLIVALFISMVSCTVKPGLGDLAPGQSQIVLSIGSLDDMADTRSAVSGPSASWEYSVRSWQAAAYDESGHLNSSWAGTGDGRDIRMDLPDGRYTILVVANMPSYVFQPDLGQIELGDCYDIGQDGFICSPESVRRDGMPACGKVSAVSDGLTFVQVPLTRLMSRVRFSLDSMSLPGFRLTGLKLCQSPSSIKPFAQDSFNPNSAETSTIYREFDAASVSEIAELNSGHGRYVSLYCLENCMGRVPALHSPADKIPDKMPSNISAAATYIEATGVIEGRYSGDLKYRFYVGANNYDDFNLIRNSNYNVTLSLSRNRLDESYHNATWKVDVGGLEYNRMSCHWEENDGWFDDLDNSCDCLCVDYPCVQDPAHLRFSMLVADSFDADRDWSDELELIACSGSLAEGESDEWCWESEWYANVENGCLYLELESASSCDYCCVKVENTEDGSVCYMPVIQDGNVGMAMSFDRDRMDMYPAQILTVRPLSPMVSDQSLVRWYVVSGQGVVSIASQQDGILKLNCLREGWASIRYSYGSYNSPEYGVRVKNPDVELLLIETRSYTDHLGHGGGGLYLDGMESVLFNRFRDDRGRLLPYSSFDAQLYGQLYLHPDLSWSDQTLADECVRVSYHPEYLYWNYDVPFDMQLSLKKITFAGHDLFTDVGSTSQYFNTLIATYATGQTASMAVNIVNPFPNIPGNIGTLDNCFYLGYGAGTLHLPYHVNYCSVSENAFAVDPSGAFRFDFTNKTLTLDASSYWSHPLTVGDYQFQLGVQNRSSGERYVDPRPYTVSVNLHCAVALKAYRWISGLGYGYVIPAAYVPSGCEGAPNPFEFFGIPADMLVFAGGNHSFGGPTVTECIRQVRLDDRYQLPVAMGASKTPSYVAFNASSFLGFAFPEYYDGGEYWNCSTADSFLRMYKWWSGDRFNGSWFSLKQAPGQNANVTVHDFTKERYSPL